MGHLNDSLYWKWDMDILDYTFVVVEPANNETDILTYSFEEQIAPATIDNVEHKVSCYCWQQELT